jgi:hypothetical protein
VTASEALLTRPPAAPGREPGPRGRALVGPLVVGGVLAAWCAVHLFTGTPWADLLSWVAAVTIGVLAPGTALVRAVRRGGAPLIEDVAWGAPAGCLVALTGWFADRTLPWSPGPFVWGPLVVALLLVLPVTRKRVLARPEPGWGAGPSVALGLTMLVAIAWMSTTNLQWLPLNPGSTGVLYSQDTLYQAGLVGELSHHLVPDYPFVAGEPLHYHWFLYAILAHLTTGTGVDPFDSSLRLGPTTVLPAVLLLAAVVARRLSGRIAAGPVAMGLLAVVDLSLANRWGWQGTSSIGGGFDPVIGLWRGSPPQALGWLAGLASLGTVVAWLRRSDVDRAVPTALLLPFFVLCTGSKSSELPVLAAGIGLAMLVCALQRRWGIAVRAGLLLVAGAVLFELAALLIYRGGSYGMILRPGQRFHVLAQQIFPAVDMSAGAPVVTVVTAFLFTMFPLMPRLVGLAWLGVRRPGDLVTWVGIGTFVGGFTAMFLFRHPAQSEIYFLVSAYPLALVVSAVGLTAQFERFGRHLAVSRRTFGLVVGGCLLAGALTAAAVAAAQPSLWPITRWARQHPLHPSTKGAPVLTQVGWYLPSMAELVIGVIVVAVLATIVIVVALRRFPGLTRGGASGGRMPVRVVLAPVAVAVLLGTGVYGMSETLGGTDGGSLSKSMSYVVAHHANDGTLPTTQDLVDGGRWLQAHAGPDDVVATNRYCVATRAWRAGHARCDAREFSTSAFSQRRSYVGGWAYADRILAIAWDQPPPYRKIPFWDPPRLEAQDQAFQAPTKAGLDALYADGVRWLWADLRDGPVARASLNQLADQRFGGTNLRIWQLRPPTTATG